MSRSIVEHTLWTCSVLSGAFILWTWTTPPHARSSGNGLTMARADYPAIFDPDALFAAADDVTAEDLFQPERTAPSPAPPAMQPVSTTPRPPLPRLVLRGVIGGPPWDVIIDGLPGHSAGTVVRDGESVAGFSIRVYARDTVRVRGADTAWTLVLGPT